MKGPFKIGPKPAWTHWKQKLYVVVPAHLT